MSNSSGEEISVKKLLDFQALSPVAVEVARGNGHVGVGGMTRSVDLPSRLPLICLLAFP